MCGIAGYFAPGRPLPDLQRLAAMTRAIRHRGPDSEGCVAIDSRTLRSRELRRNHAAPSGMDAEAAAPFPHDIGLGHCRFSIVDLTDAGHQPFWNDDRGAVVVFNGEIYNHVELREELQKRGRVFRSSSDTEVLLASYDEWGLGALERLNGFWAFALYDLRRRRLVLSRDRVGKSPLYYTIADGALYFASEIKALRSACGTAAFTVDEGAIHDFVSRGWRDLDHRTFYRDIRVLDAASYAVIERDACVRPIRFWSLPRERRNPLGLSFRDAAGELRQRLADSIRLRERADARVAMELSGGMDSSSLVALRAGMSRQERFPVYCIRFDEAEASEEPFARAVAERFAERVDYRVIRPPQMEFWEHADTFVAQMDEPFHSPNLLTNQMLRRAIRADGFRVVMTGAGGDELFAGYLDYRVSFLRSLLAEGRLLTTARELHAGGGGGALLRSLLGLDQRRPLHPVYGRLLRVEGRRSERPPRDFTGRMLEYFEKWRLPHWLRSGNTANYAIPIEPRAPFLDYRLAEFAFTLPADYLVRDGWTKAVLREAMDPLLPARVIRRARKMGFPFPYRSWLAASKPVILANLHGVEPPGIDLRKLPDAYDLLVDRDPTWLWRLVSVGLWQRRVNRGDPIAPEPR